MRIRWLALVIVALAGVATTLGAARPAAAEGITTWSQAISVQCSDNRDQFCGGWTSRVHVFGPLRMRFQAASSHCSAIRLHVRLGWDPGNPPPASSYTSPLLAPGESTPAIDFGPLRPGGYLINLSAEGVPGGCNTGRLTAWSGIISVGTSAWRQANYPSVTCRSRAWVCDPPYTVPVTTNGGLLVEFTASPDHCGAIGVRISATQDGDLHYSWDNPDLVLPPGRTTPTIYLPVPAGRYQLSVQALGVFGGCITDGLSNWAGTLVVWGEWP